MGIVSPDQKDLMYRSVTLRVVYLVNLKFKACNLTETSADVHRHVYQLMGKFFDS